MAFKNPVVSPLSESQEKLLGQLGSLKNILTIPFKKHVSIPEDQQISSLDYLIRIAESTIGAAFIDILLKKFIDEIFNTQSDKLERIILKGIAKSLDAQGKHISSSVNISNQQWLDNNAAGPLHVTFQIAKALIVKQIIAMIFGPVEKMKTNSSGYIPVDPTPVTSEETLNQVLATNSMFSTSTAEGNQYGDQEYNLIQLKERLKKGEMIFTISCQDIKIKLPKDFDEQMDNMISNIVKIVGENAAGGSGQVPNPSSAFDYIGNHVANETQRINTQENANATRKSFLQILIDKILNLMVIAIGPYLISTINQMNAENPTLNLTVGAILSSPNELKNLHSSDEAQFNIKSIFISTLTNALYALLLTIVLNALIKEIKKLIKNALAKRVEIKLQSKFKRLSQIQSSLDGAVDTATKAQQAVESLKGLQDIYKFVDNIA